MYALEESRMFNPRRRAWRCLGAILSVCVVMTTAAGPASASVANSKGIASSEAKSKGTPASDPPAYGRPAGGDTGRRV